MKALIVLVLLLLAAVSAIARCSSVNLADVTAVVSNHRAPEPTRLLMCGAALVLSVVLRRATFALPKR
jgi:hypothetical protein